ncbi:hypothetical protein GTP55_25300 [Duganella sp. FT109W]|jgi:hypothetical protein|uniref:Uncharacterized protein n=2 Tax=Duganella TaxID=75654 RepID=A0A7X4GXG5_9BURK|nr:MULTISPECIES: hypothetical protein [Duganella]MYM71518.1 hypothetical protein [Duganella margarita]MYN42664.1 hypothetical protein [Duganella margarita]QJD90830.1 hypothetical protein HH213_12485 [Duganella dendranthematis]
MKIATLISLAGTVTCSGVFTAQKQWMMAAAFICMTIYTLLDRVIHLGFIPPLVVTAFPVVALVLVLYEVLRKVVAK